MHRPILSDDKIMKTLQAMLSNEHGVDPYRIHMDTKFEYDLGMDSLDHVEFIMLVEEVFSVKVPDADAEDITKVKHALQFIAANLNERTTESVEKYKMEKSSKNQNSRG